ncbi:hypothetical protein [Acidiferrobacter sp.]|uniref:IS66 family transposase n=1 Tax=Acidiferrobacter sp. TaxID=1872107 RepID=UPI0026230CA6|nr:hypothetical protein [Acidiferrobacter sp.]
MNEPAKTPPEDAESLQRFVADLMREKDAQITLRDEAITERDATIERLTRRAELLQDQLNLAIARRYSARSEKGPSPQMGLFDEAEVEAEREALEAQASSPRCGSQDPSKRRCATSREDIKALERPAKHRSSGRRSGGVLLFLFTCPIAPFGFGVARGRDMTRLAELGK